MAMTNDVNLIERHIEKIILAAAVLFLVVVVLLVASPAEVRLQAAPQLGEPGESYSPKEVDERLLRMSAELEKITGEAKPTPEVPPDFLAELEAVFAGAGTVPPFRVVWTPPSVPLEATDKEPDPGGKTVNIRGLMRLAEGDKPLIDQPETNAAREVQVRMRTQEEVDAGQPLYKYNEVIAIHGAALFRLGQLHKKWLKDLADTAVTARLTVAVVEVQRRERQAGGNWSAPTLISRITSDAVPLPALPAYDGKNLQEVRLAIEDLAILDVQESIVEPPYWDILGRDGSKTSWLINKPRTDVSDLMDVSSLPAARTPASGGRRPVRTVGPRTPAGRGLPPGALPPGAGGFDSGFSSRRGRPAARSLPPGALPPGAGGIDSRMGTPRTRRTVRTGRTSSYDAARRESEAAAAARARSHAAGRGTAAQRQAAARAAGAAEARRSVEARRRRIAGRTTSGRYRATGVVEPGVTNQVPTFQQQLDDPAGIVEVWFHDTDLRECVTYSYSVRLVMINPLFGLFGVVGDKADAEEVTLSTEWSAWSEPVPVERPTEFFMAEAGGGGMVPVDVFTMKWGQRVRQNFTVRQGEPIGGKATVKLWKLGEQELVDVEVDFATGAIAVDLAFGKKRPMPNTAIVSSTTELLYLDVDGQLRTRTPLADKESARYKKLIGEATWMEEVQPASVSGVLARPGARPDRMSPRTKKDTRTVRRTSGSGSSARGREQRRQFGGP